MEAARAIHDARLRAGLSQQQLAERAGTSQPAVNRYERGRVQPRADVLERLLAACQRRPEAGEPERPFLGPVGYRLARHRDDVLRIVASVGASNVRVFGSVARSEDHEGSDLDLLVDLAPERSILDLVHLSNEIGDLLGVHVDVGTMDILKSRVRARAVLEARRL